MPVDPKRGQEIFLLAVEHADPAERGEIRDRNCGSERELRQRVEALLRANDESGSFLDNPIVAPVETADEAPPAANEVSTITHAGQELNKSAVIAGRYTLVEKIGEGGMGEVWVAKQTEPVKRRVALKLIKPGMDSRTVLTRFEQERQALAMMDHPNIAKVLDGGMTGSIADLRLQIADSQSAILNLQSAIPSGRPFFVMELVNGMPITKFCDETKLGIAERLELFAAVCQGVQHAHQKAIIHRDLKPSNILVTLYDGRLVPKIIDFGVAKATGGKLVDESLATQFGAVVGTLEYMSPEQAGLSAIDAAVE